MASHSRLLVAAIDFGTTYSGWAFSFKHEFETDPKKVCTKNWAGAGMMTPKAPTTVLIEPDGETLSSFGYDAESRYTDLKPEQAKLYYYFRRFKMMLHGKRIDRTLRLSDETNKSLPAKTVFSRAIQFLRHDVIATIRAGTTGADIREDDIQWVLTVPAIWEDAAKQFMREAAVEAGIKDENLMLALEPEAASIFCRLLPLEIKEGETSPFKPGAKYLLLDAGGGTIDITVHEVQLRGRLKELHKANGGDWGGTKVDEAYIQFLEDLVGDSVFRLFSQSEEGREDYQEMYRDFEIKKRNIAPNNDANVKIRIPTTLSDIYEDQKSCSFRKAMIKESILANGVSLVGDKLVVPASVMQGFFSNAIQDIVSHLKDLREGQARNISAILMVGWFSESTMLQYAIKSNFPDVTVIIPHDAALAVLKGAVIYGHDPSVIEQRICKYTYGVVSLPVFDENRHDRCKQVIVDGKLRCQDIFSKHVEIGQTVTFNDIQSVQTYIPTSDSAKAIEFAIYGSTKKSPMYVTDEGCVKLGNLRIEVSDRSVPLSDRTFLVSMTFSGTEIEVSAKEQRTGISRKVSVDFLDLK